MDYSASKASVWLDGSVDIEPTFCNEGGETNGDSDLPSASTYFQQYENDHLPVLFWKRLMQTRNSF